jgi:hypothetical protein
LPVTGATFAPHLDRLKIARQARDKRLKSAFCLASLSPTPHAFDARLTATRAISRAASSFVRASNFVRMFSRRE